MMMMMAPQQAFAPQMAIPVQQMQQVDPQMLAQIQAVAQRQQADALAAQNMNIQPIVVVKPKERHPRACLLMFAAVFGVLAAILLSLSISSERAGNVSILEACSAASAAAMSSFQDSQLNQFAVYTADPSGLAALAAGNLARSANGSIIAGVDLTCKSGTCAGTTMLGSTLPLDSTSLHDTVGSNVRLSLAPSRVFTATIAPSALFSPVTVVVVKNTVTGAVVLAAPVLLAASEYKAPAQLQCGSSIPYFCRRRALTGAVDDEVAPSAAHVTAGEQPGPEVADRSLRSYSSYRSSCEL
jgi:hypothetical protein